MAEILLASTKRNCVAIIGGGISGLSCAKQLANRGIDSVVFDTGKKYVGGRCSSRYGPNGGLIHDHSAQMVVARDPLFISWCQEQTEAGFLQPFNGAISINSEIIQPNNIFVGKNGMRSVAETLSKDVETRGDTWVGSIKRVAHGWKVHNEDFDAVVIAHNGKCADKLLSTASNSAPRVHNLLKVNFGPTLPNASSMRKMQLCSLYVLVFVAPADLLGGSDTPTGRVVTENEVLSWVCNTSKKIGQTSSSSSYTLISTREYGAANKAPQENIPEEKSAQVISDMLRSCEKIFGLPASSITPSFTKLQLWGAATPLNIHSAPCVWDSEAQIGICGDWFTSSTSTIGPGVETAYLSGLCCANFVADNVEVGIATGEYHFKSCNVHPLGDIGVPSSAVGYTKVGPKLDLNSGQKNNSGRGAESGRKSGSNIISSGSGTKRWIRK